MEDSLKIFKAKARLMVAVPLALFFNFIVFRLWINKRSFNGVFSNTTFCRAEYFFMDERIAFSISAGVGFIAPLVLRFSTESY
jgi:hypothetical protein